MNEFADVIVIGAGIYGAYVSRELLKRDLNVLTISQSSTQSIDNDSNTGIASLVNQARVHNGYHYPRSMSTALSATKHYDRFKSEFSSAIIDNFKQIYAIPKYGSLTNASQFEKFCENLNIKCEEVSQSQLNRQLIQNAWLTDEVAIDTQEMMRHFNLQRTLYINEIDMIDYNSITKLWHISINGIIYTSSYIVNCSYAGINLIESLAGFDNNLTPVKFEACEIVLFKPGESLYNNAYTFMDGPFVSIMPFSNDGLWSLTSVLHTPHMTTLDEPYTNVKLLKSKHKLMMQMLKQYLNREIVEEFEYVRSEFVIKTIALDAEKDDNRLVTINRQSDSFVSILSGKLNAIYELDSLVDDITQQFKERGIIE